MSAIVPILQKVINGVWALRKSNDPVYPGEKSIPTSGRTQAGVYVTPDRALLNDVVWAAHRYLTQTVAQLPARIMQKTSTGRKPVFNHRIDDVLNWRPNPELSPFQFRETMTGWAIMHGNGVAEIEKDQIGRVKYLLPIEPKRIEFLRNAESGELIYRVDRQGMEPVDLKSEEVFHLRGYGNGPVGLSVIEYAAQTIGWARATELFGASFFGEGMHFGGVISSKMPMKPDDMNRMRAELKQNFGGASRAGKWFIGDNDLTITKMTATPDEAQFVNVMQHQIEAICRWMGVPPHKVHHLLRMTYNNVEQMSIDVVGDSIVPWAMRLEQEAEYKLFGQNRSNFYVKFEVKGLLRGDYKSRQEGLQIQRRNGVINGNDWAEIEDIEKPLEGGDVYIVEKNMVTLEQLKAGPPPKKSKIPASKTPASMSNAKTLDFNDVAADHYLKMTELVMGKVDA